MPFANRAHEWAPPEEIETALARPDTRTGVVLHGEPLHVCGPVVLPFPNWPKELKPQHLSLPFAKRAHEWAPPAQIETALARPDTTTGVVLHGEPLHVCGPVDVPFPNWPE